MIKQLLVYFILLASAFFFKFILIPSQIVVLILYVAIILMLVTILIISIYDRGRKFHQYSGTLIGLVLLASVLGAWGASYGHNQSFGLSLWAQSSMYLYLFYFFLHAIRMRPEELERIFIIMGLVFIGLFMFQYAIYPKILFGGRVAEERGTVRIFMPGASFAGFAFYYCLNKIFTTSKKIYIGYALMVLIIPILQGTRSSILTLVLGALLFILISRQVKSKIIVMLLMISSTTLVFFIFQDIFMNLIEVSQSQASQQEDDIRVKSIKFFLTEFSPTALNYYIGNGEAHMASPYGLKIYFYKANFGFYQSDIGIIGEYSKYGILWIVCVLLIIIKLFTMRVEPKYFYIKIWAVILIINEVLGSAFSRSTEIIVIASVLYIYDVSKFKLKHEKKEPYKEILVE
jgi:hypothetical protein